jgi:hypothetical protein
MGQKQACPLFLTRATGTNLEATRKPTGTYKLLTCHTVAFIFTQNSLEHKWVRHLRAFVIATSNGPERPASHMFEE